MPEQSVFLSTVGFSLRKEGRYNSIYLRGKDLRRVQGKSSRDTVRLSTQGKLLSDRISKNIN